jgi:hypothetical protein
MQAAKRIMSARVPRGDDEELTAVDADDLSVNPLAVLGSEEANNAGNVNGLSNTVVWGPCRGVNVNLVVAHLLSSWNIFLAHGVVHVSLNATWGNTVDSDLLVTSI